MAMPETDFHSLPLLADALEVLAMYVRAVDGRHPAGDTVYRKARRVLRKADYEVTPCNCTACAIGRRVERGEICICDPKRRPDQVRVNPYCKAKHAGGL